MANASLLLRIPGDKRVFVAGMYWRHEDRAPTRKSLLAGANGEEFWAVRRRTKNRTLQSGFCRPLSRADFLGADPSALPGKPWSGKKFSLGAAVADVLQEPWLGIFEIADNLYWYIAVRDNYEILPGGDAVGDFETIDRLRREHAAYGEPAVFRNGNLEDIGALLKIGVKISPIFDVRKNPVLPAAIGGGTLVTLAVGGGIAWHIHEESVEKARLAAQERSVAIARAMEEKRAASAIVPWAAASSVRDVLQSCLQRAERLPLSKDGWSLRGVTCENQDNHQSLQAHWSWNFGATTLLRPSGQIVKSGKEILSPYPFVHISSSGDGTILDAQDAESQAYGLAQALGLKIALSKEDPQAGNGGLPGEPSTAKAKISKPWSQVRLSYKGPIWNFPPFWNTSDLLPGYRLDMVGLRWGKTGIEMLITGTLYEKGQISLPEVKHSVNQPAPEPSRDRVPESKPLPDVSR